MTRRVGPFGFVGLVGLAVAAALWPAGVGAAPGEGECRAGGPDEIGVVVVVDLGVLSDGAEGDDTVSAVCVSVPSGATGADALAERARVLGRPPLRYDPSGLLCAIDSLPEQGCGEIVDGGYRYWSYSLGVEGWRFVEGAANDQDPPPRMTPDEARARAVSQVADAAAPSSDDGFPWGLAVGVAVIGLVAVAGFVLRGRRRSA